MHSGTMPPCYTPWTQLIRRGKKVAKGHIDKNTWRKDTIDWSWKKIQWGNKSSTPGSFPIDSYSKQVLQHLSVAVTKCIKLLQNYGVLKSAT